MADLRVEGIDVNFGGVRALWDVDLTVPPASITGLIGPNGAGKTTLFNVITGLQSPGRGRVLFDGRDITRLRPHQRARLGVGRTFQRLEVFGTLTARENVQMAAETQRRKLPRGTTPAAMADQLLARVGIAHVADEPTDLLPTGLARLVELARALATSPNVLLLDEPSSGLNQVETDDLGTVLESLMADGMAILLVEHDMRLVMNVCRQVTVLDYGRVIASGDAAVVRADPVVQAAYLGTSEEKLPAAASPPGAGKAKAAPRRRPAAEPAGPRPESPPLESPQPAEPVLELVDVKAAYGRIEVVHGVSLSVAPGQVLALLGPNGAGKSTLLKLASGRLAPTAGSVVYRGSPMRSGAPQRLARVGLCTVPEGRPIFPNLTVAENVVMFTYRSKQMTTGQLAELTYQRFPVLGERRKQLAGTLSGGEQQMLAVSRALCTEPRVLLLDELSMGLAPLVVEELYEAVGGLVAREGLAVLLVEQFAETALEIAHHAAIMVNGVIQTSGTPAEVGRQVVDAYMGAAV